MVKLVFFDLDGTLTKTPTNRLVRAQQVFADDLARQIRADGRTVRSTIAHAVQTIDPAAEGLRSSQGILASCVSDPIIRFTGAARSNKQLRALAQNTTEEQWHAIIQQAFRAAYPHLTFSLKPDALKTLLHLHSIRIPHHIVTSSAQNAAQERIKYLTRPSVDLQNLCDRVHGGAQKYEITSYPSELPETITIPGLARPVYLRRGHYLDILNTIREQYNVPWDRTMVIGDIAELDLIAPAHLGARVAMVKTEHSLPHELNYIAALPNGQVVDKLTEIVF